MNLSLTNYGCVSFNDNILFVVLAFANRCLAMNLFFHANKKAIKH